MQVETAHKAGFDRISLDLMFWLPHDQLPLWEHSLRTAAQLQPHHISAYGLEIHEDTAFHARMRRNKLPVPPPESERVYFERGREMLLAAGYEHYEVTALFGMDIFVLVIFVSQRLGSSYCCCSGVVV